MVKVYEKPEDGSVSHNRHNSYNRYPVFICELHFLQLFWQLWLSWLSSEAILASTKIEKVSYLGCPSIVAIVMSYSVYVGLNS